jgi:hypothetical protein
LTDVTDGGGNFHFDGLAPGWWTVWEEMQSGWAPVTSARFDLSVPAGPACVEAAFKNRQTCAVDPFEPDDLPAQAALITVNSAPQKRTLEPPTDIDWTRFAATAGAVYTITTSSLEGDTDTYM